jgi:hypothetical protein
VLVCIGVVEVNVDELETGVVDQAAPRGVREDAEEVVVFCGTFEKPSDGLEPSTPSLPWRPRGVTRVHARSLATQFFLQVEANELSRMRRETSRVSSLMCPFCVRG